MTDNENPLLNIPFRIPFGEIRAEHVEPAIDALLKDARTKISAIAALSGPRTFGNTMLALEDAGRRLGDAMHVVSHLEAVATTPEWRAAYNAVQGPVSEFHSELYRDAGLWKAIREYADTPEAKGLTGARARFLKKTVDDFRREGADLGPEQKARLRDLDVELSRITTTFSQNVLDATNAFELIVTDERRLEGLPESAVAAARASAQAAGKDGWRFTLQAPSLVPVLTYLKDADIRRRVWHAYGTRAGSGEHDNRQIIARVLELRREKAKLLGFKNFADLVLDDRMAHDGSRARKFVDDLYEKTKRQFEKENANLEAFKKELEGKNAGPLEPWDVGYYSEKLRQKLYDFNEEELRPYFPMESVISGMFATVQRLYGIKVQKTADLSVWHESVEAYEVRDSDGTHLGSFYADMYPRDSKRDGAWMTDLQTGGPKNGGFAPNLGGISGNLNPPVGDTPALLTHRDVETLFHEFGHLLHHTLSRVEVKSLSGTNVAWDFVELPSQIMENWCWEREALDLFARHWKTKEPIPETLFQKMIRARNFRSANVMMRQLGFATVDLALHVEYDPIRDGDPVTYARKVLQRFAPVPYPEDYAMICSFHHLFAGPVAYASGYYSYKWAEVLDADAFSRFQKEGVFSAKVGEAFRREILEKGDSDDPAVLYRNFMGREPDPQALLRRSGLA